MSLSGITRYNSVLVGISRDTGPPQQAAAQSLRAPPLLRPETVRSVRHWQKGTTPVLFVIMRRALATVADFQLGISMWLPFQ